MNNTNILRSQLLFLPIFLAMNACSRDFSWDCRTIAYDIAYAHADYATQERELSLAVKEAEKFGPKDPRLRESIEGLADVYTSEGSSAYHAAKPLYERSLAIAEKTLGPDDPGLLDDLNKLGEVYEKLGNYSNAEWFYKRAVAIAEKSLGPRYHGVPNSLHNLVSLYDFQGKQAEAEKLYDHWIILLEKKFGPNDPGIETCRMDKELLFPKNSSNAGETHNIIRKNHGYYRGH